MNKPQSGVVNIRGREYQTVALRVQTFRERHPTFALITEVLHRDELCVVMRASISDDSGRIIATGHAEEYRKASEINRTSALENCETSAIGRALAALGLGGTEFASADEVARAVSGAKGEAKGAGHTGAEIGAAHMRELDEDTARYVRAVAAEVTARMPDGAAALEALEVAALDNDAKVSLWGLLDSATRSAIKRATRERDEAKHGS